jgi:hypothetical protein
MVRRHGRAGHTDHDGRERVEAAAITRRRDNGVRTRLARSGDSQPVAHAIRLDAHADEPGEPEHSRDGNMLDLLGRVWVAGVGIETLHPNVRDAVGEDDGGLDELGGDALLAVWDLVPCPAEVGERPEETGECRKTVAPENASLCTYRQSENSTNNSEDGRTDEVGEAAIKVVLATPTSVDDQAFYELAEGSKDENALRDSEEAISKAH